MKRIVLAIFVLALAVPGFALDIPTPAGYEPWFSVDGTWVEPNIIIRPSAETIPDWQALTAVVIASNVANYSPTSDPSVETLIVPAGTSIPVPGWTGPAVVKVVGSSLGVTFSQGTGIPTRYTVYRKLRPVFGACGKPGVPGVVP